MKNYNLSALLVVITIVVTIGTMDTLGAFNTPPDSSGKQSDGIKILGHLEIVAISRNIDKQTTLLLP